MAFKVRVFDLDFHFIQNYYPQVLEPRLFKQSKTPIYITSSAPHFSSTTPPPLEKNLSCVFSMASVKVTFCIIILLLGYHHVSATRPLPDVEDQVFAAISDNNLVLQVLQRGPVPPSAGNPCTNIPGSSGGGC